jgi:hypothetical protein
MPLIWQASENSDHPILGVCIDAVTIYINLIFMRYELTR